MIRVDPGAELGELLIRRPDDSVEVASEMVEVQLRESRETVRRFVSIEQKGRLAKQLTAVVDDPVPVMVEAEESVPLSGGSLGPGSWDG